MSLTKKCKKIFAKITMLAVSQNLLSKSVSISASTTTLSVS